MGVETRIKVVTRYSDGKEVESKYIPQYCILNLGFYKEWDSIRECLFDPKVERDTITQAQEAILKLLSQFDEAEKAKAVKKKRTQKITYVKYP